MAGVCPSHPRPSFWAVLRIGCWRYSCVEGLELWWAHLRTCTRARVSQYLHPCVLQASTTCFLFPDPTWVPLVSQPPGWGWGW